MKNENRRLVYKQNIIDTSFTGKEQARIHDIIINIKGFNRPPLKKCRWEKEVEEICDLQIEGFRYRIFIPNKKP